jgi:shikimate kinase
MRTLQNIYLIGFSGSGKTTLGEALAKRLKIRFYDIDNMVEKRENCTIAAIFKEQGEVYFRSMEKQVIKEVVKKNSPRVVALGGGAFESKDTRKLVSADGIVVFLQCSVPEIYKRLRDSFDRPLLTTSQNNKKLNREEKLARISRLLKKRRVNYEKADIRVSTSRRNIRLTLHDIMERIEKCRKSLSN